MHAFHPSSETVVDDDNHLDTLIMFVYIDHRIASSLVA
jgi:hypothetical protein